MLLQRRLKNEKGVSLIELILVSAIGMSVVLLGIRMYSQYQLMSYQQQLQYNVEKLFQAMKYYYQANCGYRYADSASTSGTTTGSGALVPSGASPDIVPINIQTDLIDTHFLNAWQPLNPLVDATVASPAPPAPPVSSGADGYYVQFNPVTPNATVNPATCNASSTPPCQPACGAGATSPNCIGTGLPNSSVVVWRAQVAVKLLPSVSPETAQQYMYEMSANCVSTLTGNTVLSCESTPAANGYLVWERLATYVTPSGTSPLWVSTPNLKQFRMQYTNDGMALMNGTMTNNSQNYLCGE